MNSFDKNNRRFYFETLKLWKSDELTTEEEQAEYKTELKIICNQLIVNIDKIIYLLDTALQTQKEYMDSLHLSSNILNDPSLLKLYTPSLFFEEIVVLGDKNEFIKSSRFGIYGKLITRRNCYLNFLDILEGEPPISKGIWTHSYNFYSNPVKYISYQKDLLLSSNDCIDKWVNFISIIKKMY